MAAIMKHWREAATLILVTGRSVAKPNNVTSSSADLVDTQSVAGANLDVLLLKRSAKSKFMPSLYVFPGGVASDVDFSAEWIPVFDTLGKDRRQKVFNFVQRGGQGALLFNRIRDDRFSQIPSEIAFRICAIRETFEESGVLIARKIGKRDNFRPPLWDRHSWASYSQDKGSSVFQEWRQRVIREPKEFLHMCQELSMVPDVWSLYEWSNWLTPLNVGLKQRFDTAFFMCCLDSKPNVAEDDGETVHCQWGSPYDILHEYYQESVSMAPPQLYEIRRLMEFGSASELLRFSWQRSENRVPRWLPVRINCADFNASVLPGDSLYPEVVDAEGPHAPYTRSETLAQLSVTHPHMHRMQYIPERKRPDLGMYCNIVCNVTLPGGHIAPRSTTEDEFGEI